MPTILPTHTCFDDALDFCEGRARAEAPGWRALILVHGIVLVPENQPRDLTDALLPGMRRLHAWVEDGDLVWDAGLLEGQRIVFSAMRADYYAHYRVQETTRYTMRDVLRENRRTGTYGPWRPKYLALLQREHSGCRASKGTR